MKVFPKTDCERLLIEIADRLDAMEFRFGRSRCFDLEALISQLLEGVMYVSDYTKCMPVEKLRCAPLSEVDWLQWRDRLKSGARRVEMLHTTRRDNGLHSVWVDVVDCGRHCSLLEGYEKVYDFERRLFHEFLDSYMSRLDIATYDEEVCVEGMLKRFGRSPIPLCDMAVWLVERLAMWLEKLEERSRVGEENPIHKAMGEDLRGVLKSMKPYETERTTRVWERLLWSEYTDAEDRKMQDLLWQLLYADNRTKKYRRGSLKLSGLMKVLGVMVTEDVYHCDELTLVNCIKEEDDGDGFVRSLRNYMYKGFDKGSYDEERVEKWIREKCGV